MLAALDASELQGQALAIALYLHGGVRSCEIGSVMFGQFEGLEQWRQCVQF